MMMTGLVTEVVWIHGRAGAREAQSDLCFKMVSLAVGWCTDSERIRHAAKGPVWTLS